VLSFISPLNPLAETKDTRYPSIIIGSTYSVTPQKQVLFTTPLPLKIFFTKQDFSETHLFRKESFSLIFKQ